MIQENISLKKYNTFGIDVKAKYLAPIRSMIDLRQVIFAEAFTHKPKLVLGGGSNILFTKDFEGLTLLNQLKGISVVRETSEEVWLQVYGGEVWHDLVLYCVNNNLGGIENLSLIPGSVGAAPIQNIGAYGVELKDVFISLDAVHLQTGHVQTFAKAACQFGYRNSIFKQALKGKYFIYSVTLCLQKQPIFNTAYGAIQRTLAQLEEEGKDLSIATLSEAICQIRNSKLPDPKVLGNSGSFFKNPVVPKTLLESIQKEHPNVPFYPVDVPDKVKLPAGWLIDKCGWKGKVVGNTGTYHQQALVLVNHGGATGKEIYELSEAILQSVKKQFGVELEREVNIL